MEEETIDVAPSEENGNVPAEAPSEPIAEQAVAVKTPLEPDLYELPDGRKVNAETLSKEWKENFYPDYTRKSQALAAKETQQVTPVTDPTPLTDEWVPNTYAEIIQRAKQETRAELAQEQQAQSQKQQEIETNVSNQLSEIKTSDPTVNENALFLHANKYHFSDLKAAHQNMKDMADMVKNVQTTTAANIAKRNDPVSVSIGNSGGNVPDASQFSSAAEYLQSLQ